MDASDAESDNGELQMRDVFIYGYRNGELEIVAGFCSYAHHRRPTSWAAAYSYCDVFISGSGGWRIFDYNVQAGTHGRVPYARNAAPVRPGMYIVLGADCARVELVVDAAPVRRRVLTPQREDEWIARARERDGMRCLVTGRRFATFTGLTVAHIFPRAHAAEWRERGFDKVVGDIDALPNVLSMTADVRVLWDLHRLGINIDDGRRAVAFVPGHDDVHGQRLRLEPVDELLRDHFAQCVLKHVRGAGVQPNDELDAVDLAELAVDLEDTAKWARGAGKELLEVFLRERLYGCEEARAWSGG